MTDREKANELVTVLEHSSDAIIEQTLEGVITSWNPAAEKLFGYSSEEIIGKPITLISPTGRVDEITAILEKARAGQPTENVESIRVRKDGTQVSVSLTIEPVKDALGVTTCLCVMARDLTRSRGVGDELHRMAAIVDQSDDAIIGNTLDGIITSWNPAAERMFGYSSEEIIGKSADLLNPEDRVRVDAVLAGIRSGQPLEHLETIRVRKDGTAFPVSLTISPICDSEGAIVGASTIARDMTDHKRRRTDRISAAVESIGEAVISSTLEGIITSWNPAAERLFGYSREEMLGKSGSVLTPQSEAGQREDLLFRVGAGEAVENMETIRVRKDGSTVPVSLTFAPVHDASGAIVGVASIARDLTNSQRAEQWLKRMTALLESSNAAIVGETDAIVGVTLEGIITSWNPGAEKMFGYSRQEMIGKSDTLLSPRDRVDERAATLAKIKESLGTVSHESVRVRRDGTTFPVSLTISPIQNADGAVIGVSTIARDLTGQKRDRREIADWRGKAFKWMEELEQSQRLGVMREFQRELKVLELQQEIVDLEGRARPDRGEPGDKD